MGRSSEAAMQHDEQENLSGSDDYEAWIASLETKFKTVPRVPVETACPTDSGLEKPF